MKMSKTKKRILFVCLGNICRSPAAEGVMRKMVTEAGQESLYHIDSAGIGDWHVGQLPDWRMRQCGAERGYRFDSHARQFDRRHDFTDFDWIFVMDDANLKAITSMASDDAERAKVRKLSDFLTTHSGAQSVPDPYYGGTKDFECSLDLIEEACRNLLEKNLLSV